MMPILPKEAKPESISSLNDSQDQTKDFLLGKGTSSWTHSVAVLLTFIFMLVSYCTAIVTSQVSGMKSNIFQLNSIRFACVCMVITPVMLYRGNLLRINQQHVHFILLVSVSNVTYASCLYSAASFMPVGNLDALSIVFFILTSAAVDYFKQNIKRRALIISLVACVGMLLLVQPWNISSQNQQQRDIGIPCDYLGGRVNSFTNRNYHRTNTSGSNSSNLGASKDVVADSLGNTYIIGLVLVVVSAVACTFSGNVVKILIAEYPTSPVIFWVGLMEGFISFTLNLLRSIVKEEHSYSFPSGSYCLFFLFLFILASALANTLSYVVYRYMYVSTVAVSHVFVCLILYVSQRTYLSTFYPGYANLSEMFGIAIVLFAATILPMTMLLYDKIQNQKT